MSVLCWPHSRSDSSRGPVQKIYVIEILLPIDRKLLKSVSRIMRNTGLQNILSLSIASSIRQKFKIDPTVVDLNRNQIILVPFESPGRERAFDRRQNYIRAKSCGWINICINNPKPWIGDCNFKKYCSAGTVKLEASRKVSLIQTKPVWKFNRLGFIVPIFYIVNFRDRAGLHQSK